MIYKVDKLNAAGARSRKRRLFWLGGLLGAAAFLLIYGTVPLDCTRIDWITGGYIEQDVLQHYLGWAAYRKAPLSFPLCIADSVNYPTGISVAFTDSVPLFCILFRLIEGILPEPFQFFGLFVLLCFVLQGGCAARLVGLFVDGLAKPLAASLLFILNPILLERAFRHTALSAQFLILAALYLYFDAKRRAAPPSLWFIGLSALALLIHPYFVPMVLAVLFASAVEYAVGHRALLRPLGTLAASAAACLLAAYSIGYFHTGGSRAIGFGYFCMNLNALFNPVSKGVESWSLLLPKWKQGLGTYEGFNYLGLGTLVGFGAAAADSLLHWKKRGTGRRLRAHGGLVFVCACLTVFALSNVLVLNSFVLFTLPLSWTVIDLCSILRASGRFFWVVNYLMVLCAALFFCRRVRAKQTAAVVLAVAAVQAADLGPALVQKHQSFAQVRPAYESPFTGDFWQTAAQAYDGIFSLDPEGVQDALYLQLLAEQNGMTSNDQFFARRDEARHAAAVEQALAGAEAGSVRENMLYVMSGEDTFYRQIDRFIGSCVCAKVGESWFVFAPRPAAGALDLTGEEVMVFDEIPLMIADYSDDNWAHGVLTADSAVICFYDNEVNRARVLGAQGFVVDGEVYPIISVDLGDSGWIIVRLGTSGEMLRDVRLEDCLQPAQTAETVEPSAPET